MGIFFQTIHPVEYSRPVPQAMEKKIFNRAGLEAFSTIGSIGISFLLCPYKCISVIPIIGICQAEYIIA